MVIGKWDVWHGADVLHGFGSVLCVAKDLLEFKLLVVHDAYAVKLLLAEVVDSGVDPKPFIWTAKASDILAKVTRARAKLNKMQSV